MSLVGTLGETASAFLIFFPHVWSSRLVGVVCPTHVCWEYCQVTDSTGDPSLFRWPASAPSSTSTASGSGPALAQMLPASCLHFLHNQSRVSSSLQAERIGSAFLLLDKAAHCITPPFEERRAIPLPMGTHPGHLCPTSRT